MRLHRVRLDNFRGVEGSEIAFNPAGVTIVQGPNEVGKSSIAEALDLIFDVPHDAKPRRLNAVKPVHRDVGTRVEVELSTGGYYLVYAKQWFRKPETTLAILAPVKANLTGRAAHDRVIEILDETLDRALFAALRVVQGERIDQPDASASTTLISALDRAASGESDSDAESTLWEAIVGARARYFTDTGRPLRQREARAESLAAAGERVAAARAALDGLLDDGEAYERAGDGLAAVASQLAANQPLLVESATKWQDVERLRESLQPMEMEVARAKIAVDESQRELTRRHEFAETVSVAEGEVNRLRKEAEQAQPALAQASETEASARIALDGAQRLMDAASADLARSKADLEYREAEFFSGQFQSRYESLQEAKKRESEARQFLEECRVTHDVRARVEAAQHAVMTARTAREVVSAPLEVEALADVWVLLNGDRRLLSAGTKISEPVVNRVELTVEDLITVTVGAGSAADKYEDALDEAQRTLDLLVQAHQLDAGSPLGDAMRILERRAVEEDAIRSAKEARHAALYDLSEEELAAKLAGAQEKAARYPSQRTSDFPLPATMEEATRIRDECARLAAAAESKLAQCRSEFDAARSVYQELAGSVRTSHALAEQASDRSRSERARLDAEREKRSDEELAKVHETTTQTLAQRSSELDAVAKELAERNPEECRLRHENAQAVEARLRSRQNELDRERIELGARLAAKGEQDLQATCNAAEAELARLQREHREVERRAEAAKLLFETFARHRDDQRRAYVAPYRSEVERLARIVFGPDTTVEVDPSDFSLVARTTGGVTVPYASLSTGAREQLGVIARLACAILVNPGDVEGGPAAGAPDHSRGDDGMSDAGVPVILDDALGYSDPERLRDLGVVLSSAASRAQVIVMTSTPDRYLQVGNATVVNLERRSPRAHGSDPSSDREQAIGGAS